MNPYFLQLKNELRNYEMTCGKETDCSMLEFLWQSYSCYSPVDDGEIQKCNDTLSPIYKELSLKNADVLSYLICNLCTAYQRAAYYDGILVGAHLVEELKKG